MNGDLVSIIIPTYNRARLLLETIESIQKQEYTFWECIIVDDGSDDETAKLVAGIVKNDSRVRYFIRPDYLKKGANTCRNFGFEQSNGVYINWFDSDDLMLPNLLSIVIGNFHQGVNFIGYSGYIVDANLTVLDEMNCYQTSNLYQDYLKWQLKLVTMSVVFKRRFLETHLLFNTKIFRGQETEFFSRLFFESSSSEYRMIPDKLFLYRQHKDSKTFRNENYISSYKFSQAFIIKENLPRVKIVNDPNLSEKLYREAIIILIESIKEKDYKIYLYVTSVILTSGILSKLKVWEIIILSKIFFYRGRSANYFYTRWMNFSLRF